MPPPDNGNTCLSPDEIAARLPIGRKAVYGALKRGELIGSKRCGRWMVPKQNLEAWLAAGVPDHDAEQVAAPGLNGSQTGRRRAPQPPARGSLAALKAIERESA